MAIYANILLIRTASAILWKMPINNIVLKVSLLFLIVLIIFAQAQQVKGRQSAREENLKKIEYESVNPGSPQYAFKRLKEKIKLSLLTFGKEQKAKYLSKLLDKRYKELAYLVINNEIGPLEKAVNRYNTVAGEILSSYKDKDPNLKEQIKGYVEILEILRDKYKANSAQWLLMQYTIDTTRRLSS